MGDKSGPNSNSWKGGRVVDPRGYVLVKVGIGHHLADVRGYAYEHRIVAEAKLGRRLLATEVVHHADENKTNNDPSNLVVEPSRAHHRLEHRRRDRALRLPDEPNPVVSCACGCGTEFAKYDASGRPRKFVSGHNTAERNRRAA